MNILKINKIYESREISVLLISSLYSSNYTTSDFNPMPSISFPINGGFRYRSGGFESFTDTNVILIERGNIEFEVTKLAEFNHDQTLCFQIKERDFQPLQKIFKTERTLKRNPQIEILVRMFLSVYPTDNNLLKDQIIDELLIDNIFVQKIPTVKIRNFTPWYSRKIKTAKDYIFSHSSEDISLNDISDASHISLFHFSRVFRRITGFTPYAYLLQVRIVRAQELLKKGSSVTSTAFEVGFNSVANFSFRFKEITGISPSEYKKSKNSKMY